MQEIYPLLAEAEVLVLASPIYYFTLSAQIQAPIQRFYSMMKPANVKKTALLLSSHSPGVYEGAIAEYKLISGFCGYEDMGIVTACLDEQKTDETKQKILDLVKKL
jgi:multimeric flavodoxin WrbA